MSFARRLLQEIAAAQCKAEARHIIEQAQTEIDKMEPHAKEQLLAELQDLIVELAD
jgi:F0F1-type ATP synthase membrane subunit b/b'